MHRREKHPYKPRDLTVQALPATASRGSRSKAAVRPRKHPLKRTGVAHTARASVTRQQPHVPTVTDITHPIRGQPADPGYKEESTEVLLTAAREPVPHTEPTRARVPPCLEVKSRQKGLAPQSTLSRRPSRCTALPAPAPRHPLGSAGGTSGPRRVFCPGDSAVLSLSAASRPVTVRPCVWPTHSPTGPRQAGKGLLSNPGCLEELYGFGRTEGGDRCFPLYPPGLRNQDREMLLSRGQKGVECARRLADACTGGSQGPGLTSGSAVYHAHGRPSDGSFST